MSGRPRRATSSRTSLASRGTSSTGMTIPPVVVTNSAVSVGSDPERAGGGAVHALLRAGERDPPTVGVEADQCVVDVGGDVDAAVLVEGDVVAAQVFRGDVDAAVRAIGAQPGPQHDGAVGVGQPQGVVAEGDAVDPGHHRVGGDLAEQVVAEHDACARPGQVDLEDHAEQGVDAVHETGACRGEPVEEQAVGDLDEWLHMTVEPDGEHGLRGGADLSAADDEPVTVDHDADRGHREVRQRGPAAVAADAGQFTPAVQGDDEVPVGQRREVLDERPRRPGRHDLVCDRLQRVVMVGCGLSGQGRSPTTVGRAVTLAVGRRARRSGRAVDHVDS